jgi:hypothetical protein
VRASDVVSDLTAAKIDWQDYLVNARFVRRDNVISWYNYEKVWLGDHVSAGDFLSLVDNGQFSFQFAEDGSILQLMYEFDPTAEFLSRACLSFYGAPENIGPGEPEVVQLEEGKVDSFEEELEEPGRPFVDSWNSHWLRIDYDNEERTTLVHGVCHMHIGDWPRSRVLVRGVPGPAQFIEWIMALFYPDSYRKHRLDEKGKFANILQMQNVNRRTLFFEDHDFFKYMTHLFIPMT